MSDEVVYHDAPKSDDVEQSDRGLFDFMGKKKEENKCDENAISSEFEEKVQVSEPEHKETLLEKIHQSHDHDGSSSSSSSDEECEDGEKKKKKKKPLKETIKEKIEDHKEKKEEKKIEEDTFVPVEKYEEVVVPPSTTEVVHPVPEEKKGFMEKIKDKLPGGHKKVEEEHVAPPPPTPVPVATEHDEGEQKEKKGIFEKIKEKIPGYHAKSEEEKEKEKEKVKECD